jgi:hypothetical protein
MTVAINRMLSDLDRHQTDWAPIIDVPAVATQPEMLLAWLERRLTQWDARLTSAAELAGSVEKQLDDREAAVNRWHDVFVRWRELIQRGVGTSEVSPG